MRTVSFLLSLNEELNDPRRPRAVRLLSFDTCINVPTEENSVSICQVFLPHRFTIAYLLLLDFLIDFRRLNLLIFA